MVDHRQGTCEGRLRWIADAYLDAVWRSLRRLGVPDACLDDATQQVLLIASRRLSEIAQGGERAYLLGIALRVASEVRRTVRRRREVPIDVFTRQSSDRAADSYLPDEILDNKRALALLRACLEGMPDKLRETFLLFELEERSAPEIARLLGVPIGTVASRIRRAREHIRKNLQQ